MQLPWLGVSHSQQPMQVVIQRLSTSENVEAQDHVEAAAQRVQHPERPLPLDVDNG